MYPIVTWLLYICDPTAGSGPGIALLPAWSWERGGTWEERRLHWTDQSDCCSGEKRTPRDSGGGEEGETERALSQCNNRALTPAPDVTITLSTTWRLHLLLPIYYHATTPPIDCLQSPAPPLVSVAMPVKLSIRGIWSCLQCKCGG